jgi:legumain
MRFFALVALLALLAFADKDSFSASLRTSVANGEDTWVVLVAGSTSYMNYRHQASVCHMYQVAHRYGIPDDHIIVFMEDDIVNNPSNPFRGAVYNYWYNPNGYNWNVYEGVVHDYNGLNATAENFVKVMTGEIPTTGSGKTLRSTSESNVFVYYDDHGNSNLVAMPHGKYLYGEDIATIFQAMKEKKMFKNMVFFMQACYSGSMFFKQNIPDNVYIATSAPADNSAYACWRDPYIKTFITSCWPRGWLAAMDNEGVHIDIGRLYDAAYNFTRNSTTPCQYGDVTVKDLTLKEFFHARVESENMMNRVTPVQRPATPTAQWDVPLVLARARYEDSHSAEDGAALRAELTLRSHIDDILADIVAAAFPAEHAHYVQRTDICRSCDETCDCFSECIRSQTEDKCKLRCCGYANCFPRNSAETAQFECQAKVSRAWAESCGRLGDYASVADRTFNRICKDPSADVTAVLAKIFDKCHA